MANVELSADGKRIEIKALYREFDLCRQVPGSTNPRSSDLWFAPLSWPTCCALRGVFGQYLEIGSRLQEWAWNHYKTKVEPAVTLRTLTELPDILGDSWSEVVQALDEVEKDSDMKLFDFQRVECVFNVINGSALVASECGTGKTPIMIRTLQVIQRLTGDALPALIVAPNSMKSTWFEELYTWATDLRVVVLEGNAAKKQAKVQELIDGGLDLVITNWDSLRVLSRLSGFGSVSLTEKQKSPKLLNSVVWGSVVGDECHKLKNPKAQWSMAMFSLGNKAKHRFGLSGTPTANNSGDIWGILHFIDPVGFPSKTKFLDRYSIMSWNSFGGMNVAGLNPYTAKEFHSAIDPIMIRHLKEQVMPQLPPKVRTVRFAEMSKKQADAYEAMVQQMIVELDTGLLVATNSLEKAVRLNQFASAYAEMDPKTNKPILSMPSCKVDIALELAEELGDAQCVIFTESRQLSELAQIAFGKADLSYCAITGAVSPIDREISRKAFQAGDKQFMFVTLGAGGEGLTLTAAATCIYLQKSGSLVRNLQSEDRVHRIGQLADKVTYIDVITKGTTELRIRTRNAMKGEILEEVVQDKETLRRFLLGQEEYDINESDAIRAISKEEN